MDTGEREILLRLREQIERLQEGEAVEPLSDERFVDPAVADLLSEVNRLTAVYGEAIPFLRALAGGNLELPPPPRNLFASPFKHLHASLKHLTWQARQIADGDYSQRVDFMGEFSAAFNSMIGALEDKRRTEESLRDSEATLRTLFDSVNEAIFIHDMDGRIVRVNERMLEMFGVTAGEALTHSIREDYSDGENPLHLLDHYWARVLEGKNQLFEWKARRPHDGSLFDVRVFLSKIRLNGVDSILATVTDITPLKKVEKELRDALVQVAEEKAKSEAIMAAVGDGLTVQDRNFRILYQNRILKGIFGDHRGEYCHRVYEKREAVCPQCPVAACFADGGIHTSERSVTLGDQKVIVENTASPVRDASGAIIAAVEISRNITERKDAEKKVRQISNLYAALSNTNKAIMFSRSRDALFQEICEVAVRYGRLCLAGIAMADQETGLVRTVAYSGRAYRYLDSIVVSADMNRVEGRGSTGYALRNGLPYVCNDFIADPITAPWRDAALANGIGASATFPLKQGGRSVGVLKVYSEQKGFFDENILGLLQEMAQNIGFALDNFSREERRREAEQALRESEERLKLVLEGCNDGFWDWNVATGEVAFSRRFAEMLGYHPDELEPTDAVRRQQIHPEDWPRVQASLQAHLDGSTAAYEIEFRLRTKGGHWEWVLERGRVVARDAEGAPMRMAGTTSIVTQRKRYEEELNYMSSHDAMTGLFNRAYFDAELERLAHSRHYPVSIVIADVDGLKGVNDGFGHLEGDRLIKLAAQALRESFRPEDVVARIGGDEFAVLLPHTDADVLGEAIKRIEKRRGALAEGSRQYPLSISIGAATAEGPQRLNEALRFADSRMYACKSRNKSPQP